MDGLAFLRSYRSRGGGALVIMMSAYGGEDAALAAMKEGAYDYLPKPFRPDEVVLTLRKARNGSAWAAMSPACAPSSPPGPRSAAW